MAKIIARIRLANGETGYYDDKSKVFLSWAHPEADVTDDMNCHDLRRSAKIGRIKVIEGTLGDNKTFKQILMEAKSRRTGIALKDLMGDTPIISDSGFEDVAAPTVPNEKKSTSVVDADVKPVKAEAPAPKKEPLKAAAKKAPEAEQVVEEQVEKEQAVEESEEDKAAEEADEQTEEIVEDMTIKPSTISSLKVGNTRKVKVNQKVTEATIDKEDVAEVNITDEGVTVVGKKAGKATVTIKTEKETGTVSVTVK